MTTAPTAGRLSIRQAHNTYLVASQHPAPERLRDRLDAAVTKELAPILASRLAAWFANAGPDLWLIRRLELTVDVNAAWEREAIARAWTQAVTHELSMTLQGAGDGVNALWFPDRATYLARFLVDVAEECAWGKWYYEAFAGLRPLPTSAVLRTAICEQPALGQAALLHLSAVELKQVLRALTLHDAQRVLDRLAEDASPGEAIRCFQAVWSVWQTLPVDSFGTDEERAALGLYLAASRADAQAGGLPLRTAVGSLLRLALLLAGDSAEQGQQWLAVLSRGDRAALAATVGTADAEILAPLLRCPPDWVQEVGQTLLSRHQGPVPRTSTPERRYTALGGVFLLLPLLDELPLAEAVQDWPALEEIDPVTLVRFLLLVQCCGQPRAQHAFNDPLLRDLLAVPPSLSPALLADWGVRLSPAQQHTLLATLARWHGERGAVTGEVQLLARSPARGAPLVVWLDAARGIWLAVYRYSPRQAERLPALLRERLAGEEESAVLLSHADWLEPLRREFPASRILDLAEAAATLTEEIPDLAERLARLPKLSAELAYLSLPRSRGPARPWQWTLSVAAQGLLRNFAWRLPGFAGSNLPYLYSNFLDLTASLEDEPDRRVVRLGRPPLHLILTMTGMLRKVYRLSWLDDRPFALFPEA